MPRMDGCEVARRLREQPSPAGTVPVALTSYREEEHHERSREAGFAAHLLEPVDTDAVRRVLQDIPQE